MDSQAIVVTKTGPVTRIQLNRPARHNAITVAMHWKLGEIFDDFAADRSQRVAVISGTGERAFCAGSDLKEYREIGGGALPDYPASGYAGLATRFDLDKPIIASVNGLAVGGGFEIVLACDLAIAASDASFALPEPHVGGVARALGIQRLGHQLSTKNALGILLTGRTFGAAEAQRLGLINEVVERRELVQATQAWVDLLLLVGPDALRATKEAFYRGLAEPDLASAAENQNDYPAMKRLMTSPDRAEGVAAFVEKRPPSWRLASDVQGRDR